ncbi:MAG: PA0069 family radical SAM protein, partial [Bacteroidota bacterium]
MADEDYIKGRGSQINTHNRFLSQKLVKEHWEGIDENDSGESKTEFIPVFPKSIINKVESPDIAGAYSMNPYQGCEHGCIYCYARPTHEYWGYSAGLDFEQKILVKKNAPQLLKETFSKKNYTPAPIMFSGNTDCYQPVERKLQITRKMLEVCLHYKHPVSMITKNALILRDLDILSEMAKMNLVHVSISLTTLDDSLRRIMEPRTAAAAKKLEVIRELSSNGIPVNVMMAPIIPALNSSEIPTVGEKVSEAGALAFNYTMVRLNGEIATLFTDWV